MTPESTESNPCCSGEPGAPASGEREDLISQGAEQQLTPRALGYPAARWMLQALPTGARTGKHD